MLLWLKLQEGGTNVVNITLYSGIGVAACSMIALFFTSENRVAFSPTELTTFEWCVLLCLTLFINLQTISITIALKISPHVLVTSVRTVEIVVVIIIEMIAVQFLPGNHDSNWFRSRVLWCSGNYF